MNTKKLQARWKKATAKAKKLDVKFRKFDNQVGVRLNKLERQCDDAWEQANALEDKLNEAKIASGLANSKTVTLTKAEMKEIIRWLPAGSKLLSKFR